MLRLSFMGLFGFAFALGSSCRLLRLSLRQKAFSFALLASLAILATASAQQSPLPRRPQIPPPSLYSQGEVKLWLVAKKPRLLLLDLKQRDFHVFQDKHEQQILQFAAQPREPLRVGVLLDVSMDKPLKPDALAWPPISRFLSALLGPNDRAFVAAFNDQVSLLTPWTAEPGVLDSALRNAFSIDPDNPPRLYDAIYTLCQERFASETGRKVLIVFSDSPDDHSEHTELDTLEMAHRTDTILYPVMPWEGRIHAPLFKNVHFAQTFANSTGGFFYFVVNPKDLDNSLKGIALYLSHLYEITYQPDVAPHDGRYHSIQVKCDRPGVKVYTRQGYYAPKE